MNARQRKFDEDTIDEIEALYTANPTESAAGYKYKVSALTRKVNQYQNEYNDLMKQLEYLNTNFSEESLTQIRTEICFEKHFIAQQKEELYGLQKVHEKAKKQLTSKNYINCVNAQKEQRKEYIELKKDLAAMKDHEKTLADSLAEVEEIPKIVEKEEKEVRDLEKRLDNLSHTKSRKKREIESYKEKASLDNDVMSNVVKLNSKQANERKERENFSSTLENPIRRNKMSIPLQKKVSEPPSKKQKSQNNSEHFESSDNEKAYKSSNYSEKSETEENSRSNSGSERSGSERSGSERSGSERSGSERSGSERSGSERSGSERSGSERSGSERSGSERSGSERSGSERSGSERSDNDEEKSESDDVNKSDKNSDRENESNHSRNENESTDSDKEHSDEENENKSDEGHSDSDREKDDD
ncbi:hypothetical protein TRFO_35205 [Tritrichomonas foetus]|uniref:Uncharacterized protein n=1 Tax=Tritrichomonas foetus TaxID=1144522 RepID=A0A1J4JLF5_9EUKA|nr:hypothetical protein TRFO_35205 [Tritrichomonas foetus]|eukprot:OHS98395.1 hypothetical protein TRFO_35205 [Tritrichomonas foetus]